MKTQQVPLYDQWTVLDDRALTATPISIRLPIHLMARLNALKQIFPTRSRSELMVDLLKAGLAGLEEESFPLDAPAKNGPETNMQHVVGMAYRDYSNEHYKQLAKEAGIKNPPALFAARKNKK